MSYQDYPATMGWLVGYFVASDILDVFNDLNPFWLGVKSVVGLLTALAILYVERRR